MHQDKNVGVAVASVHHTVTTGMQVQIRETFPLRKDKSTWLNQRSVKVSHGCIQ